MLDLNDKAAIKRQCADIDAASKKIEAERAAGSYGPPIRARSRDNFLATVVPGLMAESLAQEDRARGIYEAPKANNESFHKTLKEAIKRKAGKLRNHKQEAEEDAKRYRPLTVRERTAGE